MKRLYREGRLWTDSDCDAHEKLKYRRRTNAVESRYIGERWLETYDRCEKILTEYKALMEDYENDFVTKLRESLALYRNTTYVSSKQLNWLTRLEDKYASRLF